VHQLNLTMFPSRLEQLTHFNIALSFLVEI